MRRESGTEERGAPSSQAKSDGEEERADWRELKSMGGALLLPPLGLGLNRSLEAIEWRTRSSCALGQRSCSIKTRVTLFRSAMSLLRAHHIPRKPFRIQATMSTSHAKDPYTAKASSTATPDQKLAEVRKIVSSSKCESPSSFLATQS